MQVAVETTSGLQRRMTVTLPNSDIDSEIDKRLKDAQKTVQINGFRRGKVPLSVLKQRFSAGVRQEVLGELINKSYGEALEQEDINPAGMPTIEPVEGDEGSESFSYAAVFEVYPEVELADFSSFTFDKYQSEVTEADVEQMIETLRKQSAELKEVDRAAQEGDTVIVDFKGSVGGEYFEGGEAQDSSIELGSGSMIPGFESGIVGMTVGESRKIEVTFPADYQSEELKGKDAVFEIDMKAVKESNLPEIDAEFMAKFGNEDGDLDAFKADIQSNMERELETKIDTLFKGQVMDQLAEAHDFEQPSAMVAEEVKRAKQEMFQQFGQQQSQIDLSQLPDEPFMEQASKRVKLGLIVAEIVKANEIKADADSVRAEISKLASSYEKPEQVEQYYYSDQNLLNSIEMKVLEDQVVAHIVSSSAVAEQSLPYSDLMAKN